MKEKRKKTAAGWIVLAVLVVLLLLGAWYLFLGGKIKNAAHWALNRYTGPAEKIRQAFGKCPFREY